jgi:hypothetical protein
MADLKSILDNLLKKIEDVLKKSGIITTSGTIKEINTILDHKRCIFLTLDQYKKKVHINNKTYTNVSIVKDVKKHIVDHIKSVAVTCPFNKVPRPIYVMISKKLEYDENESLVFGNCNKEIGAYSNGEISYKYIEKIDKGKPSTYQGFNASCFYKKDNKYSQDEMNQYKFIYENINQDVDKLKSSSLSSYKFKGNYEVVISIPNLTKDKKFFTSYLDYYKQNMFYNLIVNNNEFLNIITIDKKIPDIFKKLLKNPVHYNKFVEFYNKSSIKDYPLKNDLLSVCYDLGCSSDNGEDFQELVPKISDTYDDKVNNAKGKAPYFPIKCLRTSDYKKNMIDYDSDEYKEGLKEKLLEGVKKYKENLERVKRGEEPEEQSGDNITDVLKNASFTFRNEKYNNKDKEDYSEDYNRKILSELAFRYNTVPGIQEMVFSVFKVNNSFTEINNVTSIMPWGNMLLEEGMVLPEGDEFNIDKNSLKSFNKQYEIKMFFNKLWLFKNKGLVRRIFDEDFSLYTKRILIIENGMLSIYGTDMAGNKDNRFNIKIITNEKYKGPVSLIIENDGIINIYDNGFNIVGRI